MKFSYINHKNEKIDLSQHPYIFQEGDLLDWVYKYDSENGKTKNYRKEPKEYKCKIAIVLNPHVQNDKYKTSWREAMDKFLNIVSVDVVAGVDGKLCTDTGCYLPCKIIASGKSMWRPGAVINELTLLANMGWIVEHSIPINPMELEASNEDGVKKYPYTYSYKYPGLSTKININIDHYTDSDFKMVVYGPTTSVLINIAGHPYIVDYPLNEGEYMVIDSRPYVDKKKRLYMVDAQGNTKNIFHYRNPEYSVFKKIPCGIVTISYSRTYGIDLTVFVERSEPLWN